VAISPHHRGPCVDAAARAREEGEEGQAAERDSCLRRRRSGTDQGCCREAAAPGSRSSGGGR
jgi:hypothetical protein